MSIHTSHLLQLQSKPSVGVFKTYFQDWQLNLSTQKFVLRSIFVKNIPETLKTLHRSTESFVYQKIIFTLLGGIIGFGICLFAFSHLSFMVFLIGTSIGLLMGWSITDILLRDQLTLHTLSIQRAVPDFLDQLSMVVSAPGFDSLPIAIHQISKNFPGILGDELRHLDTQSQYVSHQDFFRALSKKVPHSMIQELHVIVQIHQEFGGDLSQKIFQLGQTARVEQTHKAKDFANKASGLLLGPLLIFHLPALLILFLIPAVLAFTKSL